MAVVEVDLIGSLELGTFDQNGNDYDRTGRLRSTRFTAYNRTMKLIAESNTGKALQFVMCGWDSNGNLSDYIGTWSDSGDYVSLSPSTVEIKIALRYSNNSSIAVEEIVSCVVDFSAGWIIKDGEITNDTFLEPPENYMAKPYPYLIWRTDETVQSGVPFHDLLPDKVYFGAFANAKNLTEISIPPSVKKIGEESFRNTKLKSVTIARDCSYYNTSFPDDCIINFY